MNRAQGLLGRAAGPLVLLALLTAAPAPAAATPSGPPTADVMAVKVVPTAGRTEVVIDVRRGDVQVSDFLLSSPNRLVLDLSPARLVAPVLRYDGVNRGGIRNVRFGQFRSDTVRIVLDLDSAVDYQISQDSAGVHVMLATGGSFDAWPVGSRLASGVVYAPDTAAPRPPAPEMQTAAAPPADTQASPAPAPVAAPAPVRAPPAARRPDALRGIGHDPSEVQTSSQPSISVTFDHASMEEVVATFAGFSGRSIILGANIQGTVTAEIRNQPWDIAFYAILASQGLAATEEPGGIIRVDSRAMLASQDSTEPLRTHQVRIRYARASALETSIHSILSPKGKVVADTTTNSLIVTELASRIAQVDSFIQTLDVHIPEVAIQASIVFVDKTDIEDLGLQYDLGTTSQFFNKLIQRPNLATDPTGATPYDPSQTVVNLGGNAVAAIANADAVLADGNPALQVVYSTVIGNFALSTFLQALQQVQLDDVEARPQTTVIDNREAEIFVGELTPIRVVDASSNGAGGTALASVRTQQTGIILRVTPHVVLQSREVLMELYAERSSVQPSPVSEIGAVFNTQRGQTELLVRDGETAVIGGLTVTEVTVVKSGIPFLVDLPVVGSLFGFRSSREERRDLLILVTPHIVDDATGGPNP